MERRMLYIVRDPLPGSCNVTPFLSGRGSAMHRSTQFCMFVVIWIVCALVVSGCSSSGKSPTTNAGAFVNVRVSDPATCSSPKGAFSHIYVTITDVQINASASAGNNDSGWIDLTPSLAQSPQQVDLLGQANNDHAGKRLHGCRQQPMRQQRE